MPTHAWWSARSVEVNGYKIEPGANLTGADLSGAFLAPRIRAGPLGAPSGKFAPGQYGANLNRTVADRNTRWPEGFDPEAVGVIIKNVAASAPTDNAPEPLPAEPQVSVADELGKLADLRDRGILSEPDDWNNPSIERRTNPVARLFKAFGRSSKSRR